MCRDKKSPDPDPESTGEWCHGTSPDKIRNVLWTNGQFDSLITIVLRMKRNLGFPKPMKSLQVCGALTPTVRLPWVPTQNLKKHLFAKTKSRQLLWFVVFVFVTNCSQTELTAHTQCLQKCVLFSQMTGVPVNKNTHRCNVHDMMGRQKETGSFSGLGGGSVLDESGKWCNFEKISLPQLFTKQAFLFLGGWVFQVITDCFFFNFTSTTRGWMMVDGKGQVKAIFHSCTSNNLHIEKFW